MTAAATHHNIPSSAVAGSLGDGMSVNVLASVLMKGLHHSGLKKSLMLVQNIGDWQRIKLLRN